MNFDWSTFFLELINFGVLLWLLRRFLYQPVLGVIDARRRQIEERLADIERTRAEALAEKEACRRNLADLERQRSQAHADLARELEAERKTSLARIENELNETKAKRAARDEREKQEAELATQMKCLDVAGEFVARMLANAASAQLEAGLVELTVKELAGLPAAEHDRLKQALAADGLEIASAFDLSPELKSALTHAFGQLTGVPVEPGFRVDPSLLAGLRIHAGPWVLDANLQNELKFFRDAANGHA